MIQGLYSMGGAEIQEVGRLIGLDEQVLKSSTPEQLQAKVLAWVAQLVGSKDIKEEAVERAALEWVAKRWNVEIPAGISNDDLERSIRVKIAEEAAEHLTPVWRLASALARTGPADALDAKLRLLEKAASLAVPSRSRRQELVKEWIAYDYKTNDEDFIQELRPTLEVLRARPDHVGQALTLSLCIMLADGRLAMEEERLFRTIVEELTRGIEGSFVVNDGAPGDLATQLIRRVNNSFWGNQQQVGPKAQNVDAATDRTTALKAAEMTLDRSRTLEGLVLEARDKVTSGEVAKETAPKSGWQRVLGTFSGLSQFLSSKLRNEEHTVLVRIVYLSILRQHSAAVAEADAAAAAAERLQRQQEAAARAAAEAAANAPTTSEARRAIRLD